VLLEIKLKDEFCNFTKHFRFV